MREGHTYIKIGPEQFAEVFSAKFSFCTETRKFSAIRYSRTGGAFDVLRNQSIEVIMHTYLHIKKGEN